MIGLIVGLQYILNEVTVKDIINFILFLFLVFLGVSARVMIEIERNNKHLKDIKFINRYLLAIILAYVFKINFQNKDFMKNYYSEVIILFCIFVNDIINFIFDNKFGIFLYILNAGTKGITDLKKYLSNSSKKNREDINDRGNSFGE